jgi:hypothetical protein
MQHHDLRSFEFGEFVERSDSIISPEPVGGQTKIIAEFGLKRGKELRDALRLAQDNRDALRTKKARVSEALERAEEIRAELESRLAEFCEIDAAIGEKCAEEILRSIENAQEPTLELTPELQKMSDQRLSLQKRLTAARHAGERLRRELAATERDLGEAESRVESAVVAVAAFEVEPIASELAKIEQRASALRSLLLGYSALRHAGGFLPMSHCAARLVRGTRGARDPSTAALWRSYLAKLSVDSTATFDRTSLL